MSFRGLLWQVKWLSVGGAVKDSDGPKYIVWEMFEKPGEIIPWL